MSSSLERKKKVQERTRTPKILNHRTIRANHSTRWDYRGTLEQYGNFKYYHSTVMRRQLLRLDSALHSAHRMRHIRPVPNRNLCKFKLIAFLGNYCISPDPLRANLRVWLHETSLPSRDVSAQASCLPPTHKGEDQGIQYSS